MGPPRRRHLRLLSQYGVLEGLTLFAAVQLTRFASHLNATLKGWAFYIESRKVFDYAIDHAIEFRKAGSQNIFLLNDADLGRCEVTLRRNSSDFAVFEQCLMSKQYATIVDLIRSSGPEQSVHTIVDAGSNIGLAALYFARSFPHAQIICVEPEEGNFAACSTNVRANNLANVTLVRAALWSANQPLRIKRDFRDGRDWACRVDDELGGATESEVAGVRLETLAQRHGIHEFDLVKLDIEGAEKAVLLDDVDASSWLRRTRFVAIEIHDQDGYHRIASLLERCDFTIISDGELTLGVRKDVVTSQALGALLASRPTVS